MSKEVDKDEAEPGRLVLHGTELWPPAAARALMHYVDKHGRHDYRLIARLLVKDDPAWVYSREQVRNKIHTLDRQEVKGGTKRAREKEEKCDGDSDEKEEEEEEEDQKKRQKKTAKGPAHLAGTPPTPTLLAPPAAHPLSDDHEYQPSSPEEPSSPPEFKTTFEEAFLAIKPVVVDTPHFRLLLFPHLIRTSIGFLARAPFQFRIVFSFCISFSSASYLLRLSLFQIRLTPAGPVSTARTRSRRHQVGPSERAGSSGCYPDHPQRHHTA